MPIELLVRHGCNICQGLHQLHSSGITMEDLKPVSPYIYSDNCCSKLANTLLDSLQNP